MSSCSHAVPCSAKTPNCSRPRGTLVSPGHVQSCLDPDSISWGCTKPGRLGSAKVKRPDFRGCCMRPLPHGGSASLRPCCQGLSLHCPACTTRCARPPAPTGSQHSVEGLSPQPHPSRVPQGTEAPHPHSPRGRQSSQVGRPHAGLSREYLGHTDRLSWHSWTLVKVCHRNE